MEEIFEFVPSLPQERVQNHTLEQIVDFSVPRTMEEIFEFVPSLPQERVQNHTLEQIVDFSVPRIMEAIVEVGPSLPQERVQNHTLTRSCGRDGTNSKISSMVRGTEKSTICSSV